MIFTNMVVLLQLVAGLLGFESGQDAVIRTEMYRWKWENVKPYNCAVADFSNAFSLLRDGLSHAFLDEGLWVPKELGAAMKVSGNILSAVNYSLSYCRTLEQVLATMYGTGSAAKVFCPKGAQGVIPAKYLQKGEEK